MFFVFFLFPTNGGDAVVGLSLSFWWLGVEVMGGDDDGSGGYGGG